MIKKFLKTIGVATFVLFSMFGSMTAYADTTWQIGDAGSATNYTTAENFCTALGENYRIPTLTELTDQYNIGSYSSYFFTQWWSSTSEIDNNNWTKDMSMATEQAINKTSGTARALCINISTPAPAGFFSAGDTPVSDLGVVSGFAFGTFTPYMLLFIGIYVAFLLAKKLIDIFKEMEEKDKKEMEKYKEMNKIGDKMSDAVHYSEKQYEADMKAQGLDPNNNNFHNSKYYTMKNGEELYDKMLARRHKRQAS